MSKIHYQVDTGCGGVFDLPLTNGSNETFNIGTYGLITCVGVYLPLGENKCFAAHFFARVSDIDDKLIGEERDWVPQGSEGNLLEQKVVEMLERQVRPHMPADGDLGNMREKALVVCPGMKREDNDGKQHAAVGTYVVQGLRRFLGGDLEVNEVGGAFVVNHQTGERVILDHNDVYGWQRLNSRNDDQAQDWYLEFLDGEWR